MSGMVLTFGMPGMFGMPRMFGQIRAVAGDAGLAMAPEELDEDFDEAKRVAPPAKRTPQGVICPSSHADAAFRPMLTQRSGQC